MGEERGGEEIARNRKKEGDKETERELWLKEKTVYSVVAAEGEQPWRCMDRRKRAAERRKRNEVDTGCTTYRKRKIQSFLRNISNVPGRRLGRQNRSSFILRFSCRMLFSILLYQIRIPKKGFIIKNFKPQHN